MTNQKTDSNLFEKNRSIRQVSATIRLKPKSLLQILWNGIWIVIVSTIIALAAAFFFISKTTPIYTSSSSIYVEQSGPKIFTETEKGVMTQSNNYLYTQAQLIKSTPIIAEAVNHKDIQQMKTFANIKNIVSYLRSSLITTVGGNDEIIRISLSTPYPEETAQIINKIVKSYISYHATRKQSTSAEVLKILRGEQEKYNTELMEKLETMMNFKREHYELGLEDTQGNIIIARLRSFSSVLIDAQIETIESKANYDYIKEMISDPVKLEQFKEARRAQGTYTAVENEIESFNTKLQQLESKLADRLRQVKPNHPAVTALESEINSVKKLIVELDNKFIESQLAVAELQYITAKQKEDQIKKHYEDQRQQAFELNDQLAQYTLLQSDWEQTKKLCDNLNDRIKELDVTEDVGPLNIIILEEASPAIKPSEPQKSKYIIISIMLGLFLGVSLAFIRDWTDNIIHSAEEISAYLNLPILSSIPYMSRRKNLSAKGQVVHLEPDSQTAEAYRMVRTAVFFNSLNKKAKLILVTSPSMLEGKTTLASNLAISMAQVGQKILLLDADLRNPTQCKIFGTNGDQGLVSLLSGTKTLEEAIKTTEIDGLQLLPCETPLINPSEILNSNSFAKLLELLSSKYDHIIIDSPPLVPVTDAQILAATCDVTLLTVRAEKTNKKIAQQARDRLLSVNAQVLGIVINNATKKRHYSHQTTFGNYYRRSETKLHIEKELKETVVKPDRSEDKNE